MQELISLLNEETLYQFLLLFGRLVSFVAFMPVYSHTAVSMRIRVVFALYITFFLFPLVNLQSSFTQEEFPSLVTFLPFQFKALVGKIFGKLYFSVASNNT